MARPAATLVSAALAACLLAVRSARADVPQPAWSEACTVDRYCQDGRECRLSWELNDAGTPVYAGEGCGRAALAHGLVLVCHHGATHATEVYCPKGSLAATAASAGLPFLPRRALLAAPPVLLASGLLAVYLAHLARRRARGGAG